VTLDPGRSVLHYRLVKKLGEGGRGVVSKAHDSKLGREVAIKVLPAAVHGEPDRLARFERQARALASLHHPNVASIFGFEESEGVRFLVLELVAGEDLASRLKRGPFRWRRRSKSRGRSRKAWRWRTRRGLFIGTSSRRR